MNIKDIEELIELMNRTGIAKMALKRKDFEIELEKAGSHNIQEPVCASGAKAEISQTPTVSEAKSEGRYITSPMIGTFYASPSPKDPAFVSVGDRVDADKVVCIIEAMKVMNEIKAHVSGKVVEVLVKNGEPVEFGTKLFRVI